jgi:dTDP-4-amino-4,6-dideoxygalactose transaminase
LDEKKYRLQENAELASLCFATVIVLDHTQRDKYFALLREAGVEAKKYYSPSLHNQHYFKDCEVATSLSVTDMIGESVLSLPIHDNMATDDINLIVNILNG